MFWASWPILRICRHVVSLRFWACRPIRRHLVLVRFRDSGELSNLAFLADRAFREKKIFLSFCSESCFAVKKIRTASADAVRMIRPSIREEVARTGGFSQALILSFLNPGRSFVGSLDPYLEAIALKSLFHWQTRAGREPGPPPCLSCLRFPVFRMHVSSPFQAHSRPIRSPREAHSKPTRSPSKGLSKAIFWAHASPFTAHSKPIRNPITAHSVAVLGSPVGPFRALSKPISSPLGALSLATFGAKKSPFKAHNSLIFMKIHVCGSYIFS